MEKLFIKVSVVRRSRKVIKVQCFPRVGKSLARCLIVKRSKTLWKKNRILNFSLSSSIFCSCSTCSLITAIWFYFRQLDHQHAITHGHRWSCQICISFDRSVTQHHSMGFDQVQKRACCLDNNAKTHWKKALNNSSEKFHHGRLRATWWCAWKQGNTIKSRNLSSQRLRVLSWCKRRTMFPAIFEGSCALQ